MSWRGLLFGIVCLAQLGVPASLVVQHEQTRRTGTPWRFQTAPVDPADPFRGRYVRLAFAAEQEPVPLAAGSARYADRDRRLYAELARDAEGYARLVRVHDRRPQGVEYVDVFVQYMDMPDEDSADRTPRVSVRLPFDRYYLPEAQAPEVERRYREASVRAQARTYAEVRVRDGHAALVALVLDGVPVSPRP